ncbi:MAG: TolC family protein [Planctomycetota bacterium]|jgi:outer membrane protein TolC
MRKTSLSALSCLAATLLLQSACQSPLDQSSEAELLKQTVDRAIERELEGLPPVEERQQTIQEPSEVESALELRRDELDELGPMRDPTELQYEVGRLGPDLTGAEQEVSNLTLQRAIASSVRNNLGLQFASLQPAINESDVVRAEAAFDALFFANFDFTKIDEPTSTPVLMGIPLGTPNRKNDEYRFETGLRQQLTTGAVVELSTSLSRFNNATSGFALDPDPAWTAGLNLGLSQPLLRGFGSEVNTATIRLARNSERDALEGLRRDMLQVVADAETAYWDLVLAWQELAIRQWLVEAGVEVRDKLEGRLELDAKLAEYSDAVARVEERSANVLRTRRRVRAASDELKVIQNDPEVTVASEVVFLPIDDMVTTPISYSLRDAILTAMKWRPEIQQSILLIDDASIREMLADNARLPLLNAFAEVQYLGLEGNAGNAYDELNSADYINYVLGLAFEVPLGNRAAEAGFRQARLERSASIIGYRQAVQNVVLDVKNALRDVVTNYELLSATRSSRVAAAENLRTLQAEEETLAGLTPEFLNLKLNRQENLAEARFLEVQALVAFDQAVARLYQAMGIGLAMNQIDVELVDVRAGDGSDDDIDAADR